MDTARYVVAVLIVIGMPPGILWWFLIHPFVDTWRRLGVRWTMIIVTTISVLTMASLFLLRDLLVGHDLGLSWPGVSAGVTLAVAAVALGSLRRKHLKSRTLTGVPEVAADGGGGVLLTQGVYARVRNPRYVEVVLAVFAYALFSNYVGAFVVAILTVPLIHVIVLLEEPELEQRFGAEYVAYKQRVPRYFPRLS